MKALYFSLFLLFTNVSNIIAQSNCTPNISNGSYYESYLKYPINWAPLPQNNQPIKTILINFILLSDDDGSFGWKDTPGLRDTINTVTNWINGFYENVQPRGYDIILPPDYNDVMLTDSKIRIEVNDIIFIQNSSAFYNASNLDQLLAQYDSLNGTNSFEALNVFYTLDTTATTGYGGWDGIDIRMYDAGQSVNFTGSFGMWYSTAKLLAHEIGHALELKHTSSTALPPYQNILGQDDFLIDVYGVVTLPEMVGCSNSISNPNYICVPDIPYYNQHTDFTVGSTPFMSQAGSARFISPIQAGIMHKYLSLYTGNNIVKNYVKEKTPAPNNYIVDNNQIQVWDFKIKMYQNIEIMPGATLVIKCNVLMPIGGKIIVHQGGKLIIDGGTVDCAHDDLWSGIEVYGTTNAASIPYFQGVAELKNNGTIKNANKGITNWHTGSWNERGGIILVDNFNFVNNTRDIEIMKTFTTNTGYFYQGIYHFNNVNFIWNDDYKKKYTIAHVTSWEHKNLKFNNCVFTDDRTNNVSAYLTNGSRRNYGIYTIDSDIIIKDCSFSDLDFAVYSANSSTESYTRINYSAFTNNLFGVTLVNVNNSAIYSNTFTFSYLANNIVTTQLANLPNQPDITPWGVQYVNSTSFSVYNNTFYEYGPSNISTFGVVCSHAGPYDNKINNNQFNGVAIPVAAQGINRYYDVFSYNGLEFLCNEYNMAFRDQYVVPTLIPNALPITYYLTGVKDVTGVVGNHHSLSVGNQGSNYYNTTPNTVDYIHNSAPISTPTIVTPNINRISTNSDATCNGCACLISPTLFNISDLIAQIDSAVIRFNQSKNDLIALVNGGDTEGLIDAINALTPQNKFQLRQNLLNYSPYLTEEVIKLVVDNHPSKYPHFWAMELILLNIDVAKNNPDFMAFLADKQNPMPGWMRWVISNYAAYAPYTDYKLKQFDLAYYGGQKSSAYDLLIKAYLYSEEDSTYIDSAAYWIEQKNDFMYQTQLINIELQKGNYNKAQEKLATFYNSGINNLPIHFQQEMIDYINFKAHLTTMKTKEGGLMNLSKDDKNYLRLIAKNKTGRAQYEAQEVLCFFYGECGNYDIVIDNGGSNKLSNPAINDEPVEKTEIDIKMYPNPANDWLAIELPLDIGMVTINVYNLNGQLISTDVTSIPMYILETINYTNGLYIIKLSNDKGETIQTKKILIEH